MEEKKPKRNTSERPLNRLYALSYCCRFCVLKLNSRQAIFKAETTCVSASLDKFASEHDGLLRPRNDCHTQDEDDAAVATTDDCDAAGATTDEDDAAVATCAEDGTACEEDDAALATTEETDAAVATTEEDDAAVATSTEDDAAVATLPSWHKHCKHAMLSLHCKVRREKKETIVSSSQHLCLCRCAYVGVHVCMMCMMHAQCAYVCRCAYVSVHVCMMYMMYARCAYVGVLM